MALSARFVLVLLLAAAAAGELDDCAGDCDIGSDELVLLLQTGVNLQALLEPVNATRTALPLHAAAHRAVPKDVAELTGVRMNQKGDLTAFLSGLATNMVTVTGCLIAFMVLRLRYPAIYSNNVLSNIAPRKPRDSYLGWIGGSWGVTTREAARSIGFDNALQLEFCHLGMRLMAALGLPLLLILSPLHFLYGGGIAEKEGDNLSRISMSNVADGHQWLYYIHAAFVFYACLTTQRILYSAQAAFVEQRFSWLKALPLPRATTVLVEGIPRAYRSDEKVREFFSRVFSPEQVQAVWVVKHTQDLEALVAARDAASEGRRQAELQWERAGRAPDARPKVLPLALGPPTLPQLQLPQLQLPQLQDLQAVRSQLLTGLVDAIDYYGEQLEKLEAQVSLERARVWEQAATAGGVNSSTAFVTFSGRREAEMAKNLMYTADGHEWVVSVPPEPSSIRWDDLRRDERLELMYVAIGYAALGGLYIGFMPICVSITNISYAINLGPLQPIWASLAPTMGLTVFLSFLPSVMLILFRRCFTLKSDPWAQQKLQVWYFWFQVVFVIMVTAVGNDVVTFVEGVAESPFSIFGLLADQLPKASHFYLNYLVLQCSTHAMAMLRYVPLVKYLAFKAIWPEEEARRRAEPEDQDYYGLGSRSARLAIILLIGLIYSTLSPLVALMTWGTLALYRLLYGYLIVFAETKKPDLGGAFWATMLDHVHIGNIIYCMLMTGVLAKRAPNHIPVAVAVASLIYTIWSYVHYQAAFNWQKLAFNEIILNADSLSSTDTKERYVQPVLLEAQK